MLIERMKMEILDKRQTLNEDGFVESTFLHIQSIASEERGCGGRHVQRFDLALQRDVQTMVSPLENKRLDPLSF